MEGINMNEMFGSILWEKKIKYFKVSSADIVI